MPLGKTVELLTMACLARPIADRREIVIRALMLTMARRARNRLARIAKRQASRVVPAPGELMQCVQWHCMCRERHFRLNRFLMTRDAQRRLRGLQRLFARRMPSPRGEIGDSRRMAFCTTESRIVGEQWRVMR
jgi:hypothetical protein